MFDIVTADEDDASFSIDREGFDYSSLLMRPPGNAHTLIPRISLCHCRLSTTDPFLTHSHSAAATLTASRKAK